MRSDSSRCSSCGNYKVVYNRRYSGEILCKKCFLGSVEAKVKKTIRKQGIAQEKGKIALAVSGGKDSTFMLHMVTEILGDRELVAISIDEGVHPYRTHSLESAERNVKKLGLKHEIRSFKEKYNIEMDDLVKKETKNTPCTYCGVMRRGLLNATARELGASVLVMGHNLDDELQSYLLNIVRGDYERIARRIHVSRHEKFVKRVNPLREIPEKEIKLYAILKELDYYDGTCPYSYSSLRNEMRSFIDELESKRPTSKHSMLATFDRISRTILERSKEITLNECNRCGEPTPLEICKACSMLADYAS